MSTLQVAPYTPEDLLAMPDGKGHELVNGSLVELNVGSLSSWIGGRLFRLISNFVEANGLGWVWPAENGIQCFPDDPNKVRKPDASFIRKGRLPGEEIPEGWIRIVPDLAVEVISPNDLAYEVEGKVVEYLHAGVRLVWIVNPQTRIVRVHRADGTSGWLTEADELSGEDVLPGFSCRVAQLFPRRRPIKDAEHP